MKQKFKDVLRLKSGLAAYILAITWLVLYFGLGAVIFKNMANTSPALPLSGAVIAFIPVTALIIDTALGTTRAVRIAVICACPVLGVLYFFLDRKSVV